MHCLDQKIKREASVGHNIRRCRIEAGLTQEQVTARLQIEGCDLTRSSYAKIEAGLQHISVRQLWALCRILKTAPGGAPPPRRIVLNTCRCRPQRQKQARHGS